MKDIFHHRKYLQKKVIQSVRKESQKTINGAAVLKGEPFITSQRPADINKTSNG